MIDFFLPYWPLERPHLWRLFEMRLKEEAETLQRLHACRLTWGDAELDFLLSKAS